MTDRRDLEGPQIGPDEMPYRYAGNYSLQEISKLEKYMDSDFPHIYFGNKRDKGLIVEYPPEEVCTHKEWKRVLKTVLLPDFQTFDLELKRQRKIIVRFTKRLYDEKRKIFSGGNGMTFENKRWIRIPYKYKNGDNLDTRDLVFFLMHELSETDFWFKTSPNDPNISVNKEAEENSFKNSAISYHMLLDEKIANRRALRAVQRYWPDASYPWKLEYEEDRV